MRLRASEIALGLQLKKEKEKSQRIVTDAESAVSSHFHVSLNRTSVHPPFLLGSPTPLILPYYGYPVLDARREDNMSSTYFSPVLVCSVLFGVSSGSNECQ